MKKSFLNIYFIVIIIIDLNAQEYATKETIEFGGSVSYTNVTSVVDGSSIGTSLNQFSLAVPLHYFPVNGFAIGFVPALDYYNMENSSVIGLGLYLASSYNFNLESNVFPYIEGRIGYNLISTSAGEDEVSLSGLGWAIIGGLKTHIGGNALLNIGIGYAQQTLETGDYEGDRSGRNIIALSAGISLFFNDQSRELKVK